MLIDAHEHREVATVDVVGAYLLADMRDFTIVKITNTTAEMMCKVDPTYENYLTIENGKKTLYLGLVKALYGYMQSTLLWYQTFKGCLEDIGFKLNPYDPCVANRNFNDKQCTICWYVDDTKISHVDKTVVDWVINKIESNVGK